MRGESEEYEYEYEYEDEYEDEYEEYDEESGDGRPMAPTSSLSLAYIATLPLFLAYELARGFVGRDLRNTSELFMGRSLSFLGQYEDWARFSVLGVLAIAAIVQIRRHRWRLGHSVLRTWVEGLVGAVLLGPMILLGTSLLGDSVHEIALSSGPPTDLPDLARTALIFGASAWEELLFRVGFYSVFYLIVRRSVRWIGASDGLSRICGEFVAWAGSALFFAAIHLESVVSFLGTGGEPFDSGLFAWRTLAGLYLAALYRWRGAGAAAWAHALFNVSLLLGAGPGVFV